MSTPDFIPVLSAGEHPGGPKTGACFMELASFMAGEKFSDAPACAHPFLAQVSISVNDRVDDDQRQRLLPLVPRVIGTAEWNEDMGLFRNLASYISGQIEHAAYSLAEDYKHAAYRLIRAQTDLTLARVGLSLSPFTDSGVMEESIHGRFNLLANAFDGLICAKVVEPVEALEALYDRFDRAVGRTEVEPITTEQYEAFHQMVTA